MYAEYMEYYLYGKGILKYQTNIDETSSKIFFLHSLLFVDFNHQVKNRTKTVIETHRTHLVNRREPQKKKKVNFHPLPSFIFVFVVSW